MKRNRVMQSVAVAVVPLTFLSVCYQPVFAADYVDQPSRVLGAGSLSSLSVSSDGQILLTGGNRGAFLWDVTTGQLIRTFKTKDFAPGDTEVAVFPDNGRIIVSHGQGDTSLAQVWNVETGAIERTLDGIGPFRFSGDTSSMLSLRSGFNEWHALVWDTAQWQVQKEFTFQNHPRAVSLSIDGSILAVSEAHVGVHIIDVRTGVTKATLDPDPEIIALSPNGETCLTGEADGSVTLWSAEDGGILRAFDGHEGDWAPRVTALAYSENGKSAFSGTQGGEVKHWNIEDGSLLQQASGDGGAVWAISSEGEDEKVYSVYDGVIHCWDITSGTRVQEFREHNGPIWSVGVSPDQTTLVTGGGVARVWELETGEVVQTFSVLDEQAQSLVAIHPNGESVLTAGFVPRRWSIETGELIREYRAFERHEGPRALAISSDGTRIAAAYQHNSSHVDYPDEDAFTAIWDTDGGDLVRVFEATSPGLGFLEQVASITLSADGEQLLVSSEHDSHARLISVRSGEVVHQFDSNGSSPVIAFSTDGAKVVTASGDTVRIWDAVSGQLVRSINWTEAARASLPIQRGWFEWPGSVCVSYDGGVIALMITGCMEGGCFEGACLLDAETGESLRWIDRYTGFATGIFMSDGQTLVGGSYDSSITLWDLRDIVARPRFERSASGTDVHWNLGTLQFSPTLKGPWTELPARSPMPLAPVGDQGFFRVRVDD